MKMDQDAKLGLLRFSISFVENRVQLVDNKASTLLAIQAGFFGLMTWTIETLFLSEGSLLIPSYILVIVTAMFGAVVIGLLLQTIRPTRRYLSHYVDVVRVDGIKNLMWPRSNTTFDAKEFLQRISDIDDAESELEYESTLFVCEQLVARKYATYRYAVRIAKFEMLILFTSLIGLLVARIATQ